MGTTVPKYVHVISSLAYDDGSAVTFEVDARAETISHDALLRLAVDHAREQHFWHPGDVHLPTRGDRHDHDEVRDWALCFARDGLTNYEEIVRRIDERNEEEQVGLCERCGGLRRLEQGTDEDRPHGLDTGCKDCESNMYRANERAEVRRRLIGLAIMAWVKARWPELQVTISDLELWCQVTENELAAATKALTHCAP